jgi:hypothetical protein
VRAATIHLTAGLAVAALAVAALALAGLSACTGAGHPGHATHTLSPAQRFAQRAGWLPQPIIVGGGGVAVSLIGGGAGIGGGGSRPKITLPPIPPASSNQPIAMPLESYQAIATQQQEALAEASSLLTQRCMASRGFTDSASASQTYTSVATLEQIETAGTGLTSAARARTFGFGRPKGSQPAGPGIIGFVGATAFGDALKVSKAYTEALYGFSPGGGPAPRGQVSCLRLATQQTYGALSGEPDPDPVPQIAQQAVHFTQTDPLIGAADRAWSRCMARHYYHYATPGQVEGRRWPSPPTRAEIRTAEADVACKTQANLLNTWLTVEAAYQQALIAQNLAALSQLQANFAPLLQRAEAALASPAATGITSSRPG